MATSETRARAERRLGITLLIVSALVAGFAVYTFVSASVWYAYAAGALFSILALVLVLRGVEQVRDGIDSAHP
ncbi:MULTISPECIES: hypothetical protein [Mycetocola]|uniref:hypothetical protein n=1 Tax=Mycetocola TaxID=76634 RepID=UPI0011C3A10B|nr:MULTISPECIES: hypothetical protein [Mycetocola]MCS4275372.1 putative membrane protein [Mycetocola sp. BIGb0189]